MSAVGVVKGLHSIGSVAGIIKDMKMIPEHLLKSETINKAILENDLGLPGDVKTQRMIAKATLLSPEVQGLVAALKYYSDKNIYEEYVTDIECNIDGGKTAREALDKFEGKNNPPNLMESLAEYKRGENDK